MTEKELRYHTLYMDIACRVAAMSHCQRLKVGSIMVKEGRLISMAWNGAPAGFDNVCEDPINNKTLPTTLHSEANLLAKLAKSNESGDKSTIYVTHAPCIECAKLIYQCGVKEVYYQEEYRSADGVNFLKKCNIKIEQFKNKKD